MKLLRLKDACCGMQNGHVYEAEVDGYYGRVYLTQNNTNGPLGWTEWHWIPGFFSLVPDTMGTSSDSSPNPAADL